ARGGRAGPAPGRPPPPRRRPPPRPPSRPETARAGSTARWRPKTAAAGSRRTSSRGRISVSWWQTPGRGPLRRRSRLPGTGGSPVRTAPVRHRVRGSFGHRLEPDKRCPDSLPIDVESAFEALVVAGRTAVEEAGPMVLAACDWLATVAAPDGAVALSFPVVEAHPRAEHWSEWTYRPGLNPTAGLAGRLHRMGVVHPWLERATGWCWARLAQCSAAGGFDEDAHALAEVMIFLAHVPDRDRAEAAGAAVGDWLAKAAWYRADP